MSGCIYFALQAFGIDVPYHAAIIVLVIIVAGLTLPTSPGFVGTIQYCFVLGLGPIRSRFKPGVCRFHFLPHAPVVLGHRHGLVFPAQVPPYLRRHQGPRAAGGAAMGARAVRRAPVARRRLLLRGVVGPRTRRVRLACGTRGMSVDSTMIRSDARPSPYMRPDRSREIGLSDGQTRSQCETASRMRRGSVAGDDVAARRDSLDPFGLVAQRDAGPAEEERLLLQAAGIGQHDARMGDERDHVEVAERLYRPQAPTRRAARGPRRG